LPTTLGREVTGSLYVELFLNLVLKDLTPLFNDQDFSQAVCEFTDALQLKRPRHTDFQETNPGTVCLVVVEAKECQRLARVEIAFTCRDDAQTCFGSRLDEAVEANVFEKCVKPLALQSIFCSSGASGHRSEKPSGGTG
jgi:hypothetical protein